jgi:hypothetical protein
MKVETHPASVQVWFSTDEDDGTILVAYNVVDQQGEQSFPESHRFQPWQDWHDVSAWIWMRIEALQLHTG